MRRRPKPVYLVDKPPAKVKGKLVLTPTEAEERWMRVFWRVFGLGGLAVWLGMGLLFNHVNETVPGAFGAAALRDRRAGRAAHPRGPRDRDVPGGEGGVAMTETIEFAA